MKLYKALHWQERALDIKDWIQVREYSNGNLEGVLFPPGKWQYYVEIDNDNNLETLHL